MCQRANVSAQQKGKLCKSGFASLSSAKEKGATAQQAFPFLACFNEQIFLRSRKESTARADLLFHLSDQFSGKKQCTLKIF